MGIDSPNATGDGIPENAQVPVDGISAPSAETQGSPLQDGHANNVSPRQGAPIELPFAVAVPAVSALAAAAATGTRGTPFQDEDLSPNSRLRRARMMAEHMCDNFPRFSFGKAKESDDGDERKPPARPN